MTTLGKNGSLRLTMKGQVFNVVLLIILLHVIYGAGSGDVAFGGVAFVIIIIIHWFIIFVQ